MAKPKSDDRLSPKELAAVVNKKFGPETLRMGSDDHFRIQRIPTGILTLDYLLDGGFPRGRHVEIFGSYGVGKTTIAYGTIAKAQEMGLPCAFVDAERTMDPAFAAHLGVDVDSLFVHQQEHGDMVIKLIETLLRAGEYGVIVLDSIASLLPKSEQEQDPEKVTFGTAQAKLMSTAMRRLTAANRDTLLIFINQTRDAIGVVFGPRSVTSGGRAMAFYASTRLELSRSEKLRKKTQVIDPKTGDEKDQEVVIGHRVLVKLEKDKTGSRSGSTTSFVFRYDMSSPDRTEDLILLGRTLGLIVKKGTKWAVDGYKDEAQVSRAKFYRWLAKNRAVSEELEQRIWEAKATFQDGS